MSDLLLNIKGVSCAAVNACIKNHDELDLSVISLIEGSETTAVFTQNIFSQIIQITIAIVIFLHDMDEKINGVDAAKKIISNLEISILAKFLVVS